MTNPFQVWIDARLTEHATCTTSCQARLELERVQAAFTAISEITPDVQGSGSTAVSGIFGCRTYPRVFGAPHVSS